MSTKPETRLIGRIHRHVPKSVHREKMNNPFRRGTADVWYSGKSDMWIEYKWLAALPKRDTTVIKPKFEPLQREWLDGRYAEGRRVAVVIGAPDGCIAFVTPQQWQAGVARGEAQVLHEMSISKWIEEQCGLKYSQEQLSAPRTSTPLSSTPCLPGTS